jgi:NMD protein affecting ribosome stability and mRNA decay
MLTLICPKCGKEKKREQFIDNICNECYFGNKNIAELKTTEMTICKNCARKKHKFQWQAFSEDEIADFIKENLKVDLPEYSIEDIDIEFYKNKIKVIVKIKGKIGKQSLTATQEFNISLRYQYCEDCYKTISDFYKAIVQIRFSEEEIEKYKEKLGKKSMNDFILKLMDKTVKEQRRDGDYLANVQKIEKTKNGFDMYIGSKTQAVTFMREIKQHFDYERKDSKSLIGMDKTGKEKLRYTFLIRLK